MKHVLIQKWSRRISYAAFLVIFGIAGLSVFFSEALSISEKEIAIAVEFENTSSLGLKKKVKYYLPPEITPEYIVSSSGLKVGKENEDARFFLTDEIEFEPNEIKRFVILVKNVWTISTEKLDEYLGEASGIRNRLVGTVYEEISDILLGQVRKEAEEIKSAQRNAMSIQEHIESFRNNQEKLKSLWYTIDRLRELNDTVEKQSKPGLHKEKVEIILLVLTTFLIIVTVFFFVGGIMSPKRGCL